MTNFKRIIISMSMIALLSCPVFSGAHAKHCHYCLRKMISVHDDKNHRHDKTVRDDKVMVPWVASSCRAGQSSAFVLNEMNQNYGRAMPNPCDRDWVKRIRWNGGVTVDWLKLGNRSSNFMGVNYQRFSLNDAYLNIGIDVNPWTKAFASINYDATTINDNAILGNPIVYEYSAAYDDNITGGRLHALQLTQAYATFSNFDEVPVFVQVGKQFQDFSRYTLHPITRTLTQSLSEILATSIRLGFVLPSGFNGSIAAFDNPIQQFGSISKNRATNYVVALGYDQKNDSIGFDVGASWVQHLVAANDIAYNLYQYSFNSDQYGYAYKVDGLALYGDVNSGPFRIGARYTTALKRFAVNELPRYGIPQALSGDKHGAKPWAIDLQWTYAFDDMDEMDAVQSVYVGYQASGETSSLGLPKSRWVLGYNVTPSKNTSFALEWDRDHDHSQIKGGTGKNYNLVTLRSTVKFG